MKRLVSVLSWMLLIVAGLGLSLAVSGTLSRSPDPIPGIAAPTQAAAPAGIPLGVPKRVKFDLRELFERDMTARQREDQIRDWLLWVVASSSEPDTERLNEMMLDAPTIRHGYLRPASRPEYGTTRSCVLANGEVIALLPKGEPAEFRDDLARIVDEQVKNLGDAPSLVHVYEYELKGAEHATLTRRDSIPGSRLFSQEYGFHTQTVSAPDQLTAFLANTDDLTSVELTPAGLRLGGRRSQVRARNIGLTEVAAVWQAEQAIQARRGEFERETAPVERRIQHEIDVFNSNWVGRPATAENVAARDAEERTLDGKIEAIKNAFLAERAASGQELPVDASGFSLDPTYDYAGLASAIERDEGIRLLLEHTGLDASPLNAATQALMGKAPSELPLLEFNEELKKDSSDLAMAALHNQIAGLIQEHRLQVARYDGPLDGTETGMILFYTDLLAKLWALNFQDSTPSERLADFDPMTRVRISPAYSAEMLALPSTRLWFGQEDSGYNLVGDHKILFGPVATRIYAASSNPLKPGEEVAPNAQSEAFLGWWNDHYEEVARHEQEYQRLNEIMKWSMVIGWLNQAQQGQRLGFLKGVRVSNDAWFPDWMRSRTDLRFGHWIDDPFKERGYLGRKTEVMEILASAGYRKSGGADKQIWVLSGGVSLASREGFASRTPLNLQIAPNLRRAGLDYANIDAAAGEFARIKGPKYRLSAYPRGIDGSSRAELRASFAGPTKLRGRYGDMATESFSRTIDRAGGRVSVKLQSSEAEIGSMVIQQTDDGFHAAWIARDVDESVQLARKLSRGTDRQALLVGDPGIARAGVSAEDGHLYVQFVGSKRWLELAPQKRDLAEIESGWSARVADLEPDAAVLNMRWLNGDRIPTHAGKEIQWIRGPPPATAKSVEADAPRSVAADADLILDDPVAWRNSRKLKMDATLARLDELVERRPGRAIEEIAEAQASIGERGELLIREAIAELRQGHTEAAIATMNRSLSGNKHQARSMYDEIDARMSSARGTEAAELRRFAEASDWASSLALPAGDRIRIVKSGTDNIALRATLDPEALAPSRISKGEGIDTAGIYVHDSASLSNLDWQSAPSRSIDFVLSRGIGQVYRIKRKDIRHFMPSEVVVSGRTYRSADARSYAKASQSIRLAGRPARWNAQECEDDESCEEDVYLVAAESIPAVERSSRLR